MKKVVLFVCMVAVFAACGNQSKENILRKKVEAEFIQKMNDPKSYEFVSLNQTDSITYLQSIKENVDYYKMELDFAKHQYEFSTTAIPSDDSIKYAQDIVKNQFMINGLDSLEKVLNNKLNYVGCRTYTWTFRAKNAMGALTLGDYYVQVNDKDSIVNVTDNTKKLNLTCDIPGYDELLKQKDEMK